KTIASEGELEVEDVEMREVTPAVTVTEEEVKVEQQDEMGAIEVEDGKEWNAGQQPLSGPIPLKGKWAMMS
ncbi:hypothetical protein C0989_005243, partial [Termitomyces sp. Mn162]